MDVAVPERHKLPGVCYAVTDEGLELPVIDVTHPAFSRFPGPDELAVIARRTVDGFANSSRVPAFVHRWMASRSVIFRNVMAARGTYLPGVPTYLQKLPPETLGDAWAGRLDRKLLRLVGPICMRMRLRDASAMLADAAAAITAGVPASVPLHLISLAGGTAVECLNALIVLKRSTADRIAGRPVSIHVLDPDAAAASFGRRALQELQSAGGPLEGLHATLLQVPYDWRQPEDLRARLSRLLAESPLVVLSSEGGLFEYGTDDEIVSNLLAVSAATSGAPVPRPRVVFVATILSDNEVGRALRDYGKLAIRVHDRDALEALVARAGWTARRSLEEGPVYQAAVLEEVPARPMATTPAC
jgi:hypothetical protein